MALRANGYCCAVCGAKQSKAKGREVSVEVHHIHGVDWSGLIDLVIERLLPSPDDLVCLCSDCHKQVHKKEAEVQ